MKPISVQLYSIREACKEDFRKSLERVAAIGYKGVEFAGFHGMTPAELRTTLDDLGLMVSSAHMPMPNKENADEVIKQCQTLGISRLITGPGGAIDTYDNVMACVENQRAAVELLKGNGISFGLHNHWKEFEPVEDGKLPEDIMLDNVPELFAELDVYWVTAAGFDAAETTSRLKRRTPILHIKDGPVEPKQPMLAVGQGKLDMPAIIAAADPEILEWVIVELDSCATDMFDAVEESYNYLVGNGLASGNQKV
ncbi:MAG: sugar phosphate isomerase/epimerase [Lentisphaeria bacterium]|nr:sugar phosphate isomerase/epimerase [Lentisphaeria bacterium]